MIKTNAPNFPSSSLYSPAWPSFPTFPFTVTIPKYIGIIPVPAPLGGYVLFSIALPNFLGIPGWIASIFVQGLLWGLGWIGAISEYIGKMLDYYSLSPFQTALHYLLNIFDGVLGEFESVSSVAGPFSIDVAALLMGLLLVGIILLSYLVIKGILSLL